MANSHEPSRSVNPVGGKLYQRPWGQLPIKGMTEEAIFRSAESKTYHIFHQDSWTL